MRLFRKEAGNLPNCIIIGAQKCGTSSLHHYLNSHPQIIMSSHKELNYFNEELCWKRGLAWYKSYFVGRAEIYGEASPSYTNYPLYKGVAERMYSVIPDAKLIYIVRDPIERLISQYLDRVKGGQETRTISEALQDFQDSLYIWFSRYYMQLEQFLRYYPKESFLILTAEALKNKRQETLQTVFRFLRVNDSFTSEEFNELKNISGQKLKRKKPRRIVRYLAHGSHNNSLYQKVLYWYIPGFIKAKALQSTQKGQRVDRPVLDESLKKRLIDFLSEDINKLRIFTGYNFKEWCL